MASQHREAEQVDLCFKDSQSSMETLSKLQYKEQTNTVGLDSNYRCSDISFFIANHGMGLDRQLRGQEHLMILEKTLVWLPIFAW